mmetsp:Transcript_25777/g.58009  ORF Transcript_25777/g.58009 Transcript_25777/m.58009 type:complete len:262 (+) Transcript_25777:264-1049(+)
MLESHGISPPRSCLPSPPLPTLLSSPLFSSPLLHCLCLCLSRSHLPSLMSLDLVAYAAAGGAVLFTASTVEMPRIFSSFSISSSAGLTCFFLSSSSAASPPPFFLGGGFFTSAPSFFVASARFCASVFLRLGENLRHLREMRRWKDREEERQGGGTGEEAAEESCAQDSSVVVADDENGMLGVEAEVCELALPHNFLVAHGFMFVLRKIEDMNLSVVGDSSKDCRGVGSPLHVTDCVSEIEGEESILGRVIPEFDSPVSRS